MDAKVRMYKTSIAMIARHGSEAWDLTPANLKMIRAWNTGCLATITSRPHHEEGTEYTTTFDFGGDVRLKRLQWLDGALLRLPTHTHRKKKNIHTHATPTPGVVTTPCFYSISMTAFDLKVYQVKGLVCSTSILS